MRFELFSSFYGKLGRSLSQRNALHYGNLRSKERIRCFCRETIHTFGIFDLICYNRLGCVLNANRVYNVLEKGSRVELGSSGMRS